MRATSAHRCRGNAGVTRPDGWTVACAARRGARAARPHGPDDEVSGILAGDGGHLPAFRCVRWCAIRSCVRNDNRSGVRLLEHVIELLQTITAGHRQIPVAERCATRPSNTCLIIGSQATTFGAMSDSSDTGQRSGRHRLRGRRADRASAHHPRGDPLLGHHAGLSPEHPRNR